MALPLKLRLGLVLLIASAAFARSPVLMNALEEQEKGAKSIKDVKEEAAKVAEDQTRAEPAKAQDEYRLPETVKPWHYDLDLTVNLENEFNFDGVVTIAFTPQQNTLEVKFHAYKDLNLTKITAHEAGVKEELKINSTVRNNLTDICTLTFEKELVKNKNYSLTIEFHSPLAKESTGFYVDSYLTKDGNRSWYAVSHFEPVGARRAFPSFDEPAFKATFLISITHDPKYRAISNMEVDQKKPVEANKKTMTSFKQSPVMSTYLVAFAVTDFADNSNSSKGMGVWTRKEINNMTDFALDTGIKVLKELGEFTGVEYALPKMDQIALPLLSPGAMENWGLVTYRETHLVYHEKVNATSSLQKAASIISHEFAHQWFGNLVSPKWWKYLWLNEGFATYFEYYITDKIYPEYRFADQFLVLVLQGRAFAIDVTEKTRPMNYANSSDQKSLSGLFDNVAYHKAGSVIRMISHVLGEENFKKALKQYLEENKFKNAESSDLFNVFDRVAKEQKLPLPTVTVTELFDNWVNKSGFPVVNVTIDRKAKKVKVEQSRFFLDSSSVSEKDTKWWVPLSYTVQKEMNFTSTAPKSWLSPNGTSVEIKDVDVSDWIIFNVQQTGYYRVQYDEENWKAIAKFLKEGNFSAIHPLNRAQLIDDALNLARAGLLDYSVALDVMAYLKRESDYIPLLAGFTGFSFLNRMLLTTPTYPKFQKFVVNVAESLLNNVKLEESEKDSYTTKLNRIQAMKWACDMESQLCLNHASGKLNEWLKAPFTGKSFSADLKKVTLCGALRNSSVETWKNVLLTYVWSPDVNERDDILSALGCSLNPDILKNFLDLATQMNSIFSRPQAVFKAVYTSSRVGVKVALDYIIKNVEVIKTIDKSASDNLVTYVNDIANMLVSQEEVHKLEEFVQKSMLPQEQVKQALDNARKNIQWYNKNSKSIENGIEIANNATTAEANTSTSGSSGNSLAIASILLIVPFLITRI